MAVKGFAFDLVGTLPALAEALPLEEAPLPVRDPASLEQSFLWTFQSADWHSLLQYTAVWHFAQRFNSPSVLLHLLHLDGVLELDAAEVLAGLF